MGRRVTLEALREAVRVRYDLPTIDANSFVTVTDVDAMINASLSAFYGMLFEAYGDDYFCSSDTITTSADIGISSLPLRCHKVIRLWWLRGTDDVVQIHRGSARDLALAGYASKAWTQCQPKFRFDGTSAVKWLPTPSAAYNVLVDFQQIPEDLVDGDAFEAGPGWEEWVVNDVCPKIAVREDKDPAAYFAVRADWERRIRAQAPERDEGSALQLGDDTCYGESDYERRNRLTLGRW